MANALCICPDFILNNIGDSCMFSNFFVPAATNNCISIILDKNKLMEEAYASSSKKYGFHENYKVWSFLIKDSIIHAHLDEGYDPINMASLVVDTTMACTTTFDKSIVTHSNDDYSGHIEKLKASRIHLVNKHNLPAITNNYKIHTISKHNFDKDLMWVLHRTARSNCKTKSEDEYNDYVRDMLEAKDYKVKDQTREGVSQTGISSGEIDLLIEDNKMLFAIIEALKLNSLSRDNVLTHYKKLISNYNPLGVPNVYLVVYYIGTNFDAWWRRYQKLISNLKYSDLNLPENSTFDTKEESTNYASLKILKQSINYNTTTLNCTHYAVCFSK